MSDFSAVPAGTDLASYARELVRTHDTVIAGGRPALKPRALVARSWSRVLEAGLDPDDRTSGSPLPHDEVLRRRHASPLSLVVDELRQVICSVADASQLLMVVTDADGVILWRDGATRVRIGADGLGFQEGATWTEQLVGTNAIGTALAEASPVQLFSAEHFEHDQHPWYCTAVPLHDPRTGELLGIVDVSGPAMSLHPAIIALVQTAVRLAESQLWHHHELGLERLRTAAAPVLASVTGPVLLVDDHGWVAQTVGIATRDRIAAPRSHRPLTVPGLGLCLPEPLGGGWLVRPSGAETPVTVVLDLAGPPAVEITAGDRQWRSPLTVRHAEILLLLHVAGPGGLSAAALSSAVHGDPDHLVSVRAEISRLRRTLGGVLLSQPYRVSGSVRLSVSAAPTLADSSFLRDSSCPGVRALARASGSRRVEVDASVTGVRSS